MTRSLKQNDYYHGVVIPMVRSGLYDVGYELRPTGVHEFLKYLLLDDEIIDEITWTYTTKEGSTKELTTKEFSEFISKIQQWAAEYLNIYIPDPNEIL
jgi:hypothetical protein